MSLSTLTVAQLPCVECRFIQYGTASHRACCQLQAIANLAQHHIERWGTQVESERAPFAKAADVIRMLKDTQSSICKELGRPHAAYPYCTSMLGG